MLTILGRLDRRPPLKLGKIVLTLTESTKKYPLTAEKFTTPGRVRGGVNLAIDAPRASIMQHMVAPFFVWRFEINYLCAATVKAFGVARLLAPRVI